MSRKFIDKNTTHQSKISLFIDSGAYSLYQKVFKQSSEDSTKDDFSFAETDEFWQYVDEYCEFIKKHIDAIDVYVNVDVIFDPERTWKVQKYMEQQHGLKPIPVYHFGEDIKWFKKYIDNYDYIGIGGATAFMSNQDYTIFGDRIFDFVCDTPNRLPRCKLHGFMITRVSLLFRYPWYSVDSTSWVMNSRTGSIYVPRSKNGKHIYNIRPHNVTVSSRSPNKEKNTAEYIDKYPPKQKQIILKYFKDRGYKLGESEFRMETEDYVLKAREKWFGKALEDGTRQVEKIIQLGLCNDYKLRDQLNIIYYLDLEASIPEWPWPFDLTKKKGFDL